MKRAEPAMLAFFLFGVVRVARGTVLPSTLTLLVLIGCSTGAPGAGTPSQATTATITAEPSPTQTARSLSFPLEPREGWTAHGTVEIEVAAVGYTMTVEMAGLNPDSRHLLNMHAGTCAEQDTEVIIPVMQDIKADAEGNATYEQTYPLPYLIPPEGRIFTVHGDKPGNEIFVHIACAELGN